MAQGRSCAGGCGETYVDEWISQPPQVDACCAGDCRPVRSLLQALWGNRFVAGCDTCGGCGQECGGNCGYGSSGGSGCTSCGGGGGGGMVHESSGGGCNCGGGGGGDAGEHIMAQPMQPQVHYMPSQRGSGSGQVATQPRVVPGSYKVSAPRHVEGNLTAERINPARQKIEAKRASYTH